MTREQKLERWAERELRHSIDKMILDDNSGGWVVFGKCHITPEQQVFNVWHYANFVGSFGSKRSAISWCIADKNNQASLSQQIKVLDFKKQFLDNDIACRTGLGKLSRSAEFREMVKTKLEPKVSLNSAVTAELEKCISSAKYIQLRGFSNETARTSHT